MRLRHLALVASVLLTACTNCNPPGPSPTPPPRPPPAAVDASTPDCVAACSALAAAGCPIGLSPDCAEFMTTLDQSGEVARADTHTPLTCAATATIRTPPDAVKLGFTCGQ